jgi:apolipoprotein N-acyltransferase
MTTSPTPPKSRVLLTALLGGLLVYACYFPMGMGYLAWAAWIPWLMLIRANDRPRRIYIAAMFGGLVAYLPLIQWMRVAHVAMYASWVFLAFYCSFCLVLTLYAIRRLDRAGWPRWLSAPICFTAFEYFRAHFPTGFSWLELFHARHSIGFGWYFVGYTQHDAKYLLQIAAITGVYGLTFAVILVNSAILEVLDWKRPLAHYWRASEQRPSLKGGLAAAIMVALLIGYGVWELNHEEYPLGPEVALIQGNLDQDIKLTRGEEMVRHFDRLCDEAVSPPAGIPKPNLVIWPETAFAMSWFDIEEGVSLSSLSKEDRKDFDTTRRILKRQSGFWPNYLLYGLNCLELDHEGKHWKYNSALMVDPAGNKMARYDKIHLVPFGEYVPLRETFPFLKAFTPYDEDYSCKPGEHWTRFELPVGAEKYHFGCIICYEDSDPSLARRYVAPGTEGVDFLVNISNDGWFKGTAEHEEHLAISRFRAVETRRSVVRAVNMGISAIIDPDGQIVAMPGETWATSKKVEGIVRGRVPLDNRTTFYARFGEWLPILCWIILILSPVAHFIQRRRRVRMLLQQA